ncbi:LysM peptidoglycan-binding domain-containing protein [Caproiciproducens galactitolivorans]|uniref:LysM peptidoglycan-binding domain-containing protein n=1 Tax=Caproiciproducens galactitolivorans TaxID=642589 RepID=A0ABT4BXG2_9FIRM|nr:LysM peptidoglycan-binding domain-containing protein [Caproiciproducens galactitolivorans]MCY1714626.1 LysM peptidoglycan-binding domain-containing protein [Caproiciproducens galactitolivorans]
MLIHVVSAGESLWQIANYYHVSMESIISANGLYNPNLLVVGEALVIPLEDVVYIVKPGDTLWMIAQNYGVTVRDILKNNSISNPDHIYPGLAIYIPVMRHRVMPGESLWMIAQRYNVSLQDLIQVNGIENPNNISPGMILIIPSKTRPVISVNGYIYMLGQAAVPIVRQNGGYLTYLSPFAYLIKEDASLQSIDDGPALQTAKLEGVIPMMAVTNFTATSRGENLASAILNNPAMVQKLLDNIVEIMKQKGYQGLNVDFENVLPKDRIAYNNFLEQAAARMHANGYFLSTAVAPKTGPTQQGLLYEAHDYPAHGRIADFVILMTYEWGYRKGPPQPISPINKIREVLDYAVTTIPRDKIFLGFQIYARDWTLPHREGEEAETFSPQEAVARAAQFGAEIQYDYAAESPFYRYTDTQGRAHEVWFEDARSAQAKFNAAKDYHLGGISYWALGYPFPQNWVLLEDNFMVRK